MMTLLTATPGSGKSLYAVDLIRKERAKGRAVESDIDGLSVEGVKLFPAPPKSNASDEEKATFIPHDWRKVPDGTLIVYDEAHKRFPAFSGKGRSPRQIVQEMDEHRHRGIDMWFVTQHPEKMDRELMQLCGEHFHLVRAFGLQQATVWKFGRAHTNPNSATARKSADESIWSFPKDCYKLYKSSTLHTNAHKFKLPAKIKSALLSLPFIVLTLWGFNAYITPDTPEAPAVEERSEAEPTKAQALPGVTEITAVEAGDTEAVSEGGPSRPVTYLGCIYSAQRCRCFGRDGYEVQGLGRSECEAAAKAMPVNLLADAESRRGVGAAAPTAMASTADAGVAAPARVTGTSTPYGAPPPSSGNFALDPSPANPAGAL